MLNYHVKIGLAPMRRDIAQRPGIPTWKLAEENGLSAVDYIKAHFSSELVSFADLKGTNAVDVMYCESDAENVIRHFKKENVDAIMLINGNFGNEQLAAQVARGLNVPVCIWAPDKEAFLPDGMRVYDSQCGLFGISRILQRFHIPFSYIETCGIESDTFREGFERFIHVTCMIKNFRGMRIAQVGCRPGAFSSVIVNEGELLEKFGIQIVPVNMAVVIDQFNRILSERNEELEEGAKLLLSRYEVDDVSEPQLKKLYAFVLLFKWIFETYRVQAAGAECWSAMQLGVGAMPCVAYGILADMGYLVACENDLHGALTMAMLSCAVQGREVPFLGEFTCRHPENKNAELLWHCGSFGYSLRKPETPCRIVNSRQWFCVKDGEYTVARFDQDNGQYSLLSGKCRSTEGPYTFGTYLWAEFDQLSAWEKKLIEGPYIHHMAEIQGDVTAELKEFCKYISSLSHDSVS